MKSFVLLPLLIATILPLTSCKKSAPLPLAPSETREAKSQDTPLLPVKPGDEWIYQVHSEIPENVASKGSLPISVNTTRTRRFLGKVSPGEGYPETDCFEVVSEKSPSEREYVEITDTLISLRGTAIVKDGKPTKPLWYDVPIPFISAGVKAGDNLREFSLGHSSRLRKIEIIGRESISVTAGKFTCIRLLMTGKDGDFEHRRTLWFSPGNGIIREEKVRYHHEQLILRESHELTGTNVKKRE